MADSPDRSRELVSAVVVNYGRAELLRACLKSLLDQTWPRHIHNFTSRARSLGILAAEAVYFGLLLLAQPLAAAEAALARGATVTVFAKAE